MKIKLIALLSDDISQISGENQKHTKVYYYEIWSNRTQVSSLPWIWHMYCHG